MLGWIRADCHALNRPSGTRSCFVAWFPAFRFAACRAKYNRRSAALNRRKTASSPGLEATLPGLISSGFARHGGQAHEALLAEIYQVQSAIGQMTGYPEVETGGRGELQSSCRRDSLVVVSMP
jgi:hypothetical protein